MRTSSKKLAVLAWLTACACADPDPAETAQSEEALTAPSQDHPVGEENVLLPGSEPLPDLTNGPPLPAAAPIAAEEARLQRYVVELQARYAEWKAQGLDEATIDKRTMELKKTMVGE